MERERERDGGGEGVRERVEGSKTIGLLALVAIKSRQTKQFIISVRSSVDLTSRTKETTENGATHVSCNLCI